MIDGKLPSSIEFEGRLVQLRPIDDHPAYGAGDDGQIYSFYRNPDCPGVIDFGFPPHRLQRFHLGKGFKYYVSLEKPEYCFCVAVLIAQAYLGDPPEGCTTTICIDDDWDNLSPNNLKWCTKSQRRAAVAKLTLRRGEHNHFAKLTKESVAEIRRLHGLRTRREIARQFGVSASQIKQIQRGLSWVDPSQDTVRRCPQCLQAFPPEIKTSARYCSTECRVAVRKARHLQRRQTETVESQCGECGRMFAEPIFNASRRSKNPAAKPMCSLICRNRHASHIRYNITAQKHA